MPALATTEKRNPRANAVARPIKVLVPLITRELIAGDNAGLEHFRIAGEMLIEARDQVAAFKWGSWLSKNFTLSPRQALRYMRLAERADDDEEITKAPTLSKALGEQSRDARRHVGKWRPIGEFTADVDTDRLSQARQVRADEIRLHRELAIELIDLGYKALATRLHPDLGGSKDAMRRLNRVRQELKGVAEGRRYIE